MSTDAKDKIVPCARQIWEAPDGSKLMIVEIVGPYVKTINTAGGPAYDYWPEAEFMDWIDRTGPRLVEVGAFNK